MNKEIIYSLVKKHFSLKDTSIDYFKKQLFEPDVDSVYKNILGDSNELRKRWVIKDENRNNIDGGWYQFKRQFRHFISHHNLIYSEFRIGKKIINKNEIKLRKLLIVYYENMKYESEAIDDGIKCCRSCNCDIERRIDECLDKIGSQKLPKEANLQIVLSLNFADWFLCSTAEEGWGSCLKLTNNNYSYWTGLPGLIGDKNRAMLYITDGKKKSFEGITTDRFLSRTWVLLDKKNIPNIIKWYPQKFVDKEFITELTNCNFIKMNSDFISKNRIYPLYFKNGNSSFIYQDDTEFKTNYHIYGTGGGFYYFMENSNSIHTGDLFSYEYGLSGLINSNTEICECEETYCFNCGDQNNEDSFYEYENNLWCESCYNEYIRTCGCCDRQIHIDGSNWIEDENQNVCNRCFERNYFFCHKCGYNCNYEESVKLKNGDYICKECAEEMECCEVCNRKEVTIIHTKEKMICKECLEKDLTQHILNLSKEKEVA